MRSIRWVASGTVLGAALASFAIIGGSSSPSFAQGMYGDGYRYRPAPRSYGYGYGPKARAYRPRVQRRYYRPRHYYRSVDKSGSCGLYKYWDYGKRSCLDARTSPPNLK
ncbi:MAG TPA: hypothetical protein VFZ16_11335 [Hyphomicrobiaceae bacterium]|nr:hypothetical protein [Hyphomicrobiaceae bacterium]